MDEPLLLVAAIGLLLLGSGFLAGAEIALIAVRRSRMDALIGRGSGHAARVKALKDDPGALVAAVQIGTALMLTLAGVLTGYLAARHASAGRSWVRWSALPAGVALTYLVLLLAEAVPRALALRYTERAALLAGRPLAALVWVSRWPARLLDASTRAVLFLLRVKGPPGATFVSVGETRHLIRQGGEQGLLDADGVELIDSVFQFSDTLVKQVMVPRPKIFALDAGTPGDEVGARVVASGFARIPVYDADDDNMIGWIYDKDVLRLLAQGRPVDLRASLHPLRFVPETKKVAELFKELQQRRTHMALVIDEHGAVTGLVTLEDLIEELVGEIHDEYEGEERPVEHLRDGSMVVDGTLPVVELRERFGVAIPESEEYETVAGFMLDRLGSLPRGGEVVVLEQWRLTVVDVEKNRISKVKIEPLETSASG